MSKKGRVGGTIGFILALALVGGTVVYSTMFDSNAAAKANKPLGSSTGNVVSAYAEKKGVTETKKLAAETLAADDWFKAVAEGATYRSYSLAFDFSYDTLATAGKETRMTAEDLDGVLYSDKDYSYLKVNLSRVEDKKVSTSYTEILYVKASGTYWGRAFPYAQNPNDTLMLGDAEWTTIGDLSGSVLEDTNRYTANLLILLSNDDNWKFNYLTGQFTHEEKEGDNKAECTFTVGYSPRLTLTMNESKKEGEYKTETSSSYVVNYSNLNNTVVNVPESLKSKWGA